MTDSVFIESTLTNDPALTPLALALFTDETKADKNFEIVYTAKDVVRDHMGVITTNVVICYRITNPGRIGVKNPQGIPETLTHSRHIEML